MVVMSCKGLYCAQTTAKENEWEARKACGNPEGKEENCAELGETEVWGGTSLKRSSCIYMPSISGVDLQQSFLDQHS